MRFIFSEIIYRLIWRSASARDPGICRSYNMPRRFFPWCLFAQDSCFIDNQIIERLITIISISNTQCVIAAQALLPFLAASYEKANGNSVSKGARPRSRTRTKASWTNLWSRRGLKSRQRCLAILPCHRSGIRRYVVHRSVARACEDNKGFSQGKPSG